MNSIDPNITAQLPLTLRETTFTGLGQLYRGKVRDVYVGETQLVMITSDRVSAFDRVLGTIPFKGEVLNRMAAAAFEGTQDILPNHIISLPDPNVVVAKKCKPYPVEFIVRGYITGSLWRDYQAGTAGAYGLPLPDSLQKDQAFDQPILTPSTKAEQGAHDEPISKAEIIRQGLLTEDQFNQAADAAFKLFARGRERAGKQGLILVDTKYEFGEDPSGILTVIDEIHTPDSSRYWIQSEYQTRFEQGQAQRMLDKENLREWLMKEHNFQGDGEAPPLTDEIRCLLSQRYFEAYRAVVGTPFEPHPGDVLGRIEHNLKTAGLL